ncbi:MAG: cation:proton antiporter, partial [Deltaproteobacteria bacterium]|nr:cation:proton antiporter [Deltaproteobacteria bacterium]
MLSVSDSVIVLLIFMMIASLSMPMLKKLHFPHSVFLVMAGVATGVISQWLYDYSGVRWITDIAGGLSRFHLSSEAILVIFLPTLIFESSYNINSRELIKDLPSTLILAVPALLISLFTVGVMLHYSIGFDLRLSLLFGALISATDPVAVIAIFRELGAPRRLTMLVEGESLFNDATAIVIFTIILGLITATEKFSLGQSVVAGTGQFIIVFMGGVSVGLICGYLFSKILGTIKANPPVEIILTTTLAYLSFLIAHHYFHVSGVMSTVAAGVLLGSYGRTKISVEVHEFMENFWATMAFAANAVLFLYIGLLLPQYLSVSLLARWPLLIVAVIAINAGRAFSIFTLLPFLSSIGFIERISRQFMIVLWWGGGLRGAIAIALALSLIGSELAPSSQQTIVVLTLGVVLFTLMVNALSMRRVIAWLGMDRLSKEELYSQKMGLLQSKSIARQKVEALSENSQYCPAIYIRLIEEYRFQEDQLQAELSYQSEMSSDERYEVLAREALLVEKNAYFEIFASGFLSELSLHDLQGEVDNELDRLKAGQSLFGERRQFGRKGWIEKMIRPFEKFLPQYTTRTLAMRYEKASATTDAIDEVITFLEEKGESCGELGPHCSRLKTGYLSLHASADEEVAEIVLNFPEYVENVVEIVLRTFSLNTEKNFLGKMSKLGQLPDISYTGLKDRIEERLAELERMPVEKINLDPVQLLKQVSFFGVLDDAYLDRLSRYFHTKPFLKRQQLIKEGSRGDDMFIIIRGVVRVFRGKPERPEILATLKSGDILGEMALISKKPRNASAVALSHGSALVLNRGHFQEFLSENPEVRK